MIIPEDYRNIGREELMRQLLDERRAYLAREAGTEHLRQQFADLRERAAATERRLANGMLLAVAAACLSLALARGFACMAALLILSGVLGLARIAHDWRSDRQMESLFGTDGHFEVAGET